MEITIEGVVIFVLIFGTVVDARTPGNEYAEEIHSNSNTRSYNKNDVAKSTRKRELPIREIDDSETMKIPELLKDKLNELIGEDDASKLEFIDHMKDILGVNSHENEDGENKALRSGGFTEYGVQLQNSIGRDGYGSLVGALRSGKLRNFAFSGEGLPYGVLAHLYQLAALRNLLINQGRLHLQPRPQPQLFTSMSPLPTLYTNNRNIPETQTMQANMQLNFPNIQPIHVTLPPAQIQQNLPIRMLEKETFGMLNQNQNMRTIAYPSVLNDNAYPYDPIN